jgi:6-phosphogluconolactonase (cycloisomerase 2 family)
VATQGAGGIYQYTINRSTGALSPKNPPSVTAFSGATGIAINPDGKSAYAAIYGAVAQYDIDPLTGNLSLKPAPIISGDSLGIAVARDGKSAYAAGTTFALQGVVNQYDVDPVSGALSPKTHPIVLAGGTPFVVAVTP